MNILGLFLIFNTLLFIIAFGISLAILYTHSIDNNLLQFLDSLDTNPNYLFREVSDIVFGIEIEHILFGAVVILVSLYYYT